MRQVNGRDHVQFDEIQVPPEVRVFKMTRHANARIQRDGIERAAGGLDLLVNGLIAFPRREVSLKRLDARAIRAESFGGRSNAFVLSHGENVESVLRELRGKFIADPARSAGHYGEFAGRG